MPKERRTCQHRASPYPSRRPSPSPPPLKNPPPSTKELDEVRCPICLDHPHNAVLLACKSITKGCHPYICNTSQRYSNCLNQFKKMSEQLCQQTEKNPTYSCPLCRGEVTEVIIPSARDYLNEKVRSCSKESCNFNGTYKELRKHVWKEHPMDNPTEPDPVRQSEWKRLERRSEFSDLVSTMRSDFGESDAGLTSVVRIPSMSIVIVVRMNSTTRVSTHSALNETIVIDDDDDDDDDDDGDDGDDDDDENDDDDGIYDVSDSDDTEFEDEDEDEEEDEDGSDECYVIGSRRR